VGGDSVSGRCSTSGSAVDDGRDTALGQTIASSEAPPEERALDVSRGFFFDDGGECPNRQDPAATTLENPEDRPTDLAQSCSEKPRHINGAVFDPLESLGFAERCDMPQKQRPAHALFVRWRELEIGAFGIPAIIAFVVVALLLARWSGVL
jgi:hypothetical protein